MNGKRVHMDGSLSHGVGDLRCFLTVVLVASLVLTPCLPCSPVASLSCSPYASRDIPRPLSRGIPLPPSRGLYPVASSFPWRTAGDGRWACTKIVPKKCQHSAKLLFAHSLHEVARFLVHGELAQHNNNNVTSYNRGVFCIKLVLPWYMTS